MNQSNDKRQKIVNTAIKLFVKNGLHNTSMRALAKEAGVATGSLYTYFDSKKQLIIELFYAYVEESAAVLKMHDDPTQSVKQRFYTLLGQNLRLDMENPDKFRLMRMCAYEPIIMETINADSCENSPLAAVLEAGKAQGLIKNLPMPDLFYQVFGGAASLLEWRLFNQETIDDIDITMIIDVAWDAIKQ